jgi:single-stranded-DNA-specific exonuclease
LPVSAIDSGLTDLVQRAALQDAPHTRQWTTAQHDPAAAEALSRALSLPLPIAQLLACRGCTTPEAARAFLNPSLDGLHSPALILGMDLAVARLRAALTAREPILIYGDYDVDGTVATVLLKTAAERAAAALGVTADVRYHIPHRIREGYGMQASRLEAAKAEGVRLVISVDTGIRAFAAAEEAARLNLDLIVTDHHLPDPIQIPQAIAVLNPNQPNCPYPNKELCGAGVAFKLAQALLESTASTTDKQSRLREKTLPSFLKLLAIATIADAVPLTGENRVIATLGLRELRRPAQSGLRALMELAQIDPEHPVSATDVGFRIAPRINAAGRMDVATDVVEMFLARDPALARSLAEKLHRLNEDRRAVEAEALREIEARLAEMAATPEGLAPCLVLDDANTTETPSSQPDATSAPSYERGAPQTLSSRPERSGVERPAVLPGDASATLPRPRTPWHRGVIGILASRVVDRAGRPALVLAHEDGEAYGSGRSVAGFHLLDALTAVHTIASEPLFSRFGGHAHAVGFSLPSTQVAELRDRMVRYAAEAAATTGIPIPTLGCDTDLHLTDLTREFFASYDQLAPFGNGNPEPIFVSLDLRLASPPKFFGDRHVRLDIEDANGTARFKAVAWGRRTDWVARVRDLNWTQGSRIDLAYKLRLNRHKDFGGWEFEVLDLRPASNPT